MKEKMITPDAIISEMEKLRESGQETEQETTGRNTGTDFPIDVLPYKMQRIVREARVTIGFPEDYLAPSMLVAVAPSHRQHDDGGAYPRMEGERHPFSRTCRQARCLQVTSAELCHAAVD